MTTLTEARVLIYAHAPRREGPVRIAGRLL